MQKEIAVSFSIAQIPNSGGMRIKSDKPTGVYVSSNDSEASQFYFLTTLSELVTRRKLIAVGPGESIAWKEDVNWECAAKAGSGTIVLHCVRTSILHVATALGSPISPPGKKLTPMWFGNQHGHEICFVSESKDDIDPWLMHAAHADLQRQRN